jgi:hypothetical protein
MGEWEFEQKALVKAVDQALMEQGREAIELRLITPGGRFQVRWDEGGRATALGQLAFFAEFLEVSGLFERWVDGCPLASDDLTSRKLRRPQFEHQPQVRARKERFGRIEFLAEFRYR